MTNNNSNSSETDSIVEHLHLVREAIVDSFAGDLHALTDDARSRQLQSGRTIWHRKSTNNPMHPNGGPSVSGLDASTPATR